MVTGDHPAIALAIARAIGLRAGEPVVVSTEDTAQQSQQLSLWRSADELARGLPAQKLELVRALQTAGEFVAVTGDGVNDVPALQIADVGIAMGERGTRSAREVAAIVLLDDNFRTIVRAVAEGRQLFHNLRLSFAYLLMVHIPLVLSAALVPIAGYPLLYLPIHIVWLELIIYPTALLVFQELPSSDRLMPSSRADRHGFFGTGSRVAIGSVGALITCMVVLGYAQAIGAERNVPHARAMALTVLIVASAVITAALSGLRTWTARVIVAASLASLGLLVQIPALARTVHVQPLHLADWGLAASGGVCAGMAAALAALTPRGRDHTRLT